MPATITVHNVDPDNRHRRTTITCAADQLGERLVYCGWFGVDPAPETVDATGALERAVLAGRDHDRLADSLRVAIEREPEHPVDSTYHVCCHAIGGHARTCPQGAAAIFGEGTVTP